MKKIILIMAMSVLLFSCKTSSITDKKLDRTSQVAIKGNWTITAVTYPGSEYIKVNSFDIADSNCFVGSTWKFISNNNKGEMALTKYDCPVFSSPITWFVNSNGEFVLKVLDAGEKAKKVRAGYVLQVANQTENSFQLVDKINVGTKMTAVVYQFQKAN
ncbi:lipocalin family protein [Flavobacterium muglaense]|uniref:Lipocalin family protein n=1 Tax=Flavobacterium muglaense TaxID=2764716 RepID=A0A923SEP6_9FLAO|nr:lipocalin family protein [Flavobacterium muglaense]MBC5837111.1 lipocalin family protein [Flavobacterium muglaense]MBC5843640.1 lipocalin family protein [Flavobacterium muglaense]